MSSDRWKAIKRDDGKIELGGFPGVTHVLTQKETVGLAHVLLEVAGEPTIGEIKGRYPALVELVQNWQGELGQRARVELLTLWGVFGPPDESAELERLRVEAKISDSEIRMLQHAVRSWLEEEEDWKAEEKRLRGIENAIRACPQTLAQPGNIPALVETVQLRGALYGIEDDDLEAK